MSIERSVNFDRKMQMWEAIIRRTPDIRVQTKVRDGEEFTEIGFPSRSRKTPEQRVDFGQFKEYWVQKYISENYEFLGFSDLKGPRPDREPGPDFEVLFRGRWYDAEAEVKWQNYIAHGHPENERFRKVRYLIVLSNRIPTREKRKQLPREIVQIDRDHFLKWYLPLGQAYAIDAQRQSRINLRLSRVAGEMQGMFIDLCPDRGREMAICPQCGSCPYFDGGKGTAGAVFSRMAMDYIAEHAIERNAESDDLEIDLTKIHWEPLSNYVIQQMMTGSMFGG